MNNCGKHVARVVRMVATFAVFGLVLSVAGPAFADVPVSITQQGRLLDDGEPMTGTQTLEFTLFNQQSGGDVLWSEQIDVDLGDDGVYTATLGDATQPIDATLLQGGEVYLELEVEGEVFAPRLELTSVPFAALAQSATVAQSVVDGGVTSEALAPGAVTTESIDSVSWSQVTDIPQEVSEGSDTLAELSCDSEQVAVYDGSWSCGDFPEFSAGTGLQLAERAFSIEEEYFQDNYLQLESSETQVVDSNIDFGGSDVEFSGNGNLRVECSSSANCSYLRLGENSRLYEPVNDGIVVFDDVGSSSTELKSVRIDRSRLGVNKALDTDLQARFHVKRDGSSDRFSTAMYLEHTNGSQAWGLGVGEGSDDLRFGFEEDVNKDSQTSNLVAGIDSDSGEFQSSSDESLKRDIESLEGILDDVLDLRPTRYRFIQAGPDASPTVGFIAQEVKRVFPDLVKYYEDSGTYALSYGNFGVLAIQAIQEQQEIIDAKTAEIETLRQELESMDERLSRLEANR